jgi:hypothetical protein
MRAPVAKKFVAGAYHRIRFTVAWHFSAGHISAFFGTVVGRRGGRVGLHAGQRLDDAVADCAGSKTISIGSSEAVAFSCSSKRAGVYCNGRRLATQGITPVNFSHRKYRRAFLWFDPPEAEFGLHEGHEDVDKYIAQRGTIQHQIYTGDKAIPVAENAAVQIRVNCAEHAGNLADEIPYAIAVTLELAQPILTSIYEEIREKVQARIRLES